MLVRMFSIIGGIYMIFKTVDTYLTFFFCSDTKYTEVNSGSQIEMS